MYGMDARVGISFQNSMGTAAVGSMHWLQPTADNISLKKGELVRKGMRGVYAEGARIEGLNTVTGDITLEAAGISLGVVLEACMARTSVNSGAFSTHTFKPRNADFDKTFCAERPFTLHSYLGDAGSANLYSDLNGNTLDIAISNGQLMTVKLGVIGGRYSQQAPLAAAYETEVPFDWSVSSISIAGAARLNVEAMQLAYKNQLSAKSTLGDGSSVDKYPSRLKRGGPQMLEISGTVLFDDQTDLQQFIAQSRQHLVMSFKGASNISSGYNEVLTIDVPALLITDFPQGIPTAGELTVAFKGVAEYHVGSGTTCAITLVNTIAGY